MAINHIDELVAELIDTGIFKNAGRRFHWENGQAQLIYKGFLTMKKYSSLPTMGLDM